ncbi:hypothetical protein [Kitasatospora sp. NBC_01300]|uniref:hypothetical protein n=1 Tax=Kitasatospora sp. NBC_01300 TaxID=2903574 RepID=UPI002F90737E|nr:hypothetical protein OG556_40445 [Kitasatospora sp. NBC_01300]
MTHHGEPTPPPDPDELYRVRTRCVDAFLASSEALHEAVRAEEPHLYQCLSRRCGPLKTITYALQMDLTLGARVEPYIAARREALTALYEATDRWTEAFGQPWDDAGRGPSRLLAGAAVRLAGSRRSHLRQAWLADLAGDPASGLVPSSRQRRALAAGFLVAAVRLRLHDTMEVLWKPADWVLTTSSRTTGAVVTATGALALYIDATGGLHQLLTTGVQACSVTAPSLYGLARWVRRVRGIEPSAPPAPPSDDSEGTPW